MKLAIAGGMLLTLMATRPAPASGQVLVRVGEPGRATYSELHEGLRAGTPAADSVLVLLREDRPEVLWRRVHAVLADSAPWNDAHLALTRLAELRSPAFADSAASLARRIEAGEAGAPPGRDPADLLPPLRAVQLEHARAVRGDAALLRELLALVPSGDYGLGEAWVLGRLGAGAADSLRARFLAAPTPELKVRYLTLLSFSDDTTSIPLLARVYAAPDSFGVPPRYGSRASDALIWIGTRASLQALLDARERARALGSYADPALRRGGYDFLANDSSAVISRTGKWLREWVRELGQETEAGAAFCPSAAPRGAVRVPRAQVVREKLPLGRDRALRVAAPEMLDVRGIVGHPRQLAQQPHRPRDCPATRHTPSPRRAPPSPWLASGA